MTRGTLAGMLMAGVLVSAGCGVSLAELAVPAGSAQLARVRRGGQAWGCRERASEVFLVYLVCPSRHTTFGVLDRGGQLALACPDHSPSQCEALAHALLRGDGAVSSKGGP